MHWAIGDAMRAGTCFGGEKPSFHTSNFLTKLRECGYDVTQLPEDPKP